MIPVQATLALAALQRRAEIQRVVLEHFEVTTSRRFAVRRTAVYEAVATALGDDPRRRQLALEVCSVVEALGARAVTSGNRRLFSALRRRGIDDAAALAEAAQCRSKTRKVSHGATEA